MFTVCPKCALTLAVTAGDLRTGQGYVRCGRCASVFNALVSLSDDSPAADAAPASVSPQASQSVAGAAHASDPERTWDPESLPEDSLEFTLGSAEVGRIFVEAEPDDPEVGTGTFEQIVLESPEQDDDGEQPVPDESTAEEPQSFAAALQPAREDTTTLAAANDGDIDTRPEATIQATTFEAAAPGTVAASPEPEANLETEESSTEPPRRWPLIAGIAALGLVLLAQWVHHRRNDLALLPGLTAPLSVIYGALGLPLTPSWDLGAYDVRQLGASEPQGEPGRLVVRASLRNGAPRPQPLPLLRLTLRDRYGTLVAGRDLAPREYLGSGAAASSPLGAGQRVDASIVLLDPGDEAVGFEIDACLPARAGIRCAADLPPRAP